MRGFASVLFDESHRESWSIRPETAKAMNPGHPADAGYLTAAALLRHAVMRSTRTPKGRSPPRRSGDTTSW
jgi:hypothetical protein